MKIAKTKSRIRELIQGQAIGFVPTMGALHEGHLSLVRESKSRGLFTVVSIFVNPTQFNNPEDLARYPVDLDRDQRMLEVAGCDLVFIPDREEIYPAHNGSDAYIHDFGFLESRFEGHFRPGHFRGVGQVVHIFFEIIQPGVAFFGEKDFQQLQVIRRLVEITGMDTEIVGMPTIREEDGLAMSSRNRRLNKQQRTSSLILHKALAHARQYKDSRPLSVIRQDVAAMFSQEPLAELEYFDIIHSGSFDPAETYIPSTDQRVVIAAYVGEVRLIDNMALD